MQDGVGRLLPEAAIVKAGKVQRGHTLGWCNRVSRLPVEKRLKGCPGLAVCRQSCCLRQASELRFLLCLRRACMHHSKLSTRHRTCSVVKNIEPN